MMLGDFVSGGVVEPSEDRVPNGMFAWPLEQPGEITSHFGWRDDPLTHEWSYHSGTDIAAPGGAPILAAAAGIVTIANASDAWGGGLGYYVKISHEGGVDTLYAHCRSLAVSEGEQVTQGQVIAYVGTTGRSTGCHLHWEVQVSGERRDALAYFR
jgi:murein DD-endopeptidase MepM/ murein hydrolase activator NlpD